MTLTCSFCGNANLCLKINRDLPPQPSYPLRTFALFKPKTKASRANKVEKPKPDSIFVGRVAMPRFATNLEEESRDSTGFGGILVSTVLAFSLFLCSAANGEEDGVRIGGGALFNRACIGCHVGGGNVIQPGATLFAEDLERNGVATEEEIYQITYSGKGRMPGFGEKCTPRGQCTFGPRLLDQDIRLLAQFVKSQAQQGWPKID